MQYTIRPALRQDLPAIVDIYNSTVATRQSTADLSPTTVAEREMWFAAHTDKRPIYALYDADGTVLAWAVSATTIRGQQAFLNIDNQTKRIFWVHGFSFQTAFTAKSLNQNAII